MNMHSTPDLLTEAAVENAMERLEAKSEAIGTKLAALSDSRELPPEERRGLIADTPSPDFDWNDDDAVLLEQQPLTAIYENPKEQIVIRQSAWPDDDVYVVISRPNLMTVIDRLCELAGVGSAGRGAA